MLFLALAASVVLQQTPSPAPAPVTPPSQSDAAATAPAAAGPGVAPTNQAEAPTQVCRMEAVTGSRFGRRVCRSVVQTDEDRANSREMLRQMQGARVPSVG